MQLKKIVCIFANVKFNLIMLKKKFSWIETSMQFVEQIGRDINFKNICGKYVKKCFEF